MYRIYPKNRQHINSVCVFGAEWVGTLHVLRSFRKGRKCAPFLRSVGFCFVQEHGHQKVNFILNHQCDYRATQFLPLLLNLIHLLDWRLIKECVPCVLRYCRGLYVCAPQNSYLKPRLPPRLVMLGGRAFGTWLGHEGGDLFNEISALMKRRQRDPCPHPLCEDEWEGDHLWSRKGAHRHQNRWPWSGTSQPAELRGKHFSGL